MKTQLPSHSHSNTFSRILTAIWPTHSILVLLSTLFAFNDSFSSRSYQSNTNFPKRGFELGTGRTVCAFSDSDFDDGNPPIGLSALELVSWVCPYKKTFKSCNVLLPTKSLLPRGAKERFLPLTLLARPSLRTYSKTRVPFTNLKNTVCGRRLFLCSLSWHETTISHR